MNAPDESRPLLSMHGIRKQFGAATVLHDVDFDVRSREVHALVGENGAGKSTLIHILAGVLAPEAGRIDFNGGSDLHLRSAHEAQERGIAAVFQERSLFPHLTIADNIFAGRQPLRRWGRIDQRGLRNRTAQLLEELGLDLKPDQLVETLSPDQQQLVEVAKALSLQARLVIFDEPTASLGEAETAVLFRVIGELRRRGMAIIFISHRLEEIFDLADRVTVLKDGRVQATLRPNETNADELVRLMVGRTVLTRRREQAPPPRSGPPRLSVRGLADPAWRHGHRTWLRRIDFDVWPGEIVGLGGLSGAGRTETALTIIGARERGAGEIRIDGAAVNIRDPEDAVAAGVGYLSEDRKADGIFAEMDLPQNIGVAALHTFGSWWFDERQQREAAHAGCRRLRVAYRDLAQPIIELSGGNQQKCLFNRWLLVNPKVLIVDEPTRGIDIGAKAEVHALLYELAAQGAALVVISSDLPELLAVSDRIVVIRNGQVAGELEAAGASEEDVIRLASLESNPGV